MRLTQVSSLLIEHLKKRNSHGNGSYPPFFYCNSNPTERVRASPEEIFRSLVRQLSCHSDGQGIESLTKDIYKERKRTAFAAGPLSLEESISTIIKLSGNRPRSIIVIDALDECDPRERKHLLDGLLKIVKDTTTSVKVFVSSRDDGDIVDQMSVFPTIESAEEQNQRDIDSFVNSEVDKYIEKKWLLGGKVPEALHQKIKDTLRKQAQGM